MKKLFTILFLCVGTLLATTTYASVSTAPASGTATVGAETKLGIDDLKTMTVKEIEAKIGHDLTWKQKLAIKMLKNKAAKAEEHPDKPASNGSTILGLLLGFVLGLIGVLIAYLAFKNDKDTIKGAWIGLAIWVVLFLLII
ncbi:MAG: hypothetical protein SFV55_26525 [Haliscomenobacter sp.]|uniref:hypothetical protein n=1 Tax=Haliscomenobacter sp. TaxID=2717303 RepID=UPI0029BAF905|nr:hypothetical protein [Haliscomenobacter sp.]MDX2072017.1 hypothetical protein [Haliscomenobacter sp.]